MSAAIFQLYGLAAVLRRSACIISVAAAMGASPAACAWDWSLGLRNSVSGSGTIRSETRAVSGFTGISLFLNGTAEIRQGATEGVTIETDDNLLPLVETAVEDGTLKIRPATHGASFSARKMKFIVHAKTIDSLAVAGSGEIHADTLKASALKASITGAGDIRIRALEAGALSVKIAGSGDFAAAGRAASLNANIAGSGDIDAANLETRSVEITIAGSGDARVWARETLDVSVAGSGDVEYYGDARVNQSIGGSGSIKRLGASPAGS